VEQVEPVETAALPVVAAAVVVVFTPPAVAAQVETAQTELCEFTLIFRAAKADCFNITKPPL